MTDQDKVGPFGKWLVEARGAAGLTQEELAEQAGVHVNTIKNLESGTTQRPQPPTAAALRKRLGEQPEPEEVREEYDRRTKAFLELVGAYLMAQPEEARLDRIFDLTRYLVSPKG